jgi:energy-coupling factor transport system ATP-binding protein
VVGQDPLAGFVTDTVEDELAYAMEQLGLPAA